MNPQQVEVRARRSVIKHGLGSVAGVALVFFASHSVRAAPGKLAKSAVSYVDHGTVKDKDCDDCIQFMAGKTAQDPGSCKIVEGEINPHGHCAAFSPKPKG